MMTESLLFLGNHLLQSTLFGAVVYVLTLMLKKNRAAVRYRLWVVASLKFLVPFAVLIAIGRQVPWPAAPIEPHPALVSAIEGFSQPFGAETLPVSPAVPQTSPVPSTATSSARTIGIWTYVIGIWLCGGAFVLALWFRAWLRVRRSLSEASPVDLQLPSIPIPVMMTASRTEPGIVGILRPVLVLPKGLLQRLSPAQTEAVVSHELCHVRRRDNLFAAIHMVIETIFWFHPLVWWIERRLIEERELACDEEVLQRGSDPEAYAEGILNVCKFYKESALVCVSGVAGANLRKRVEDIMIHRVAHRLNFVRVALLAMAAAVTLAGPVAIGIVQASARQSQAAYTFTTIDVPESSQTVATGIDTLGRIVGYYADARGTHGFLLTGGTLSTIDFPGAAWTAAYGINAAGQIVGAYGPNDRTGRHGFLLSGSNYSSFDFPASIDTVARGVNNRGQIVGDYLGQDGFRHGFLLSGGNYSTIEFPQSGSGVASAITDSGQIAGLAGTGADGRGFLFSDGSYVRIQFPGSNYTEVLGVNNLGDLVGIADGPQPPTRAFRRAGGNYVTLDLPDAPFSGEARGVNDLGQIVGTFTARDGKTRGYRATPTALRIGPADTQGISNLTNAAPGKFIAAPTDVPGTPPGPQGPVGPQGPQGPPGPPGPAAVKPEPTPQENMIKALETMLNRVNGGSSAIQKTVPYRQGREMGKALEKGVAALAVVSGDITSAIAFVRSNSNVVARAPAVITAEISFEAPVPGGTAGPNVPPGVAVGLNNLKAGYEALKRAPGGDIGGFREKINTDLARAVELIYASLTVEGDRGERGQRGGRGGATTAAPANQ